MRSSTLAQMFGRAPLIAIVLSGVAPSCAAAPGQVERSMEKRPSKENAAGMTVKATCRDADPCAWRGDDLFLAIRLVNTRAEPVGVPLAYVQRTGPAIRLVDARSGAENQLRTNLADLDLRRSLTVLAPGEAVVVEWVIHESELVQFGDAVDLTAEITVFGELEVNGAPEPFEARDALRITGRSAR